MQKDSKSWFSTTVPARKLFLKRKQVCATRCEEILDFFMQNRSKIAIFDGKNLYSGVKSGGGRCPPHQNLWGGIRPLPPASYAYALKTTTLVGAGVAEALPQHPPRFDPWVQVFSIKYSNFRAILNEKVQNFHAPCGANLFTFKKNFLPGAALDNPLFEYFFICITWIS